MLAIDPNDRALFEGLCKRERCPVAFIGVATGDERLVVEDSYFNDRPIDMDIRVLLGKPRKCSGIQRAESNLHPRFGTCRHRRRDLPGLNLPAVADKSFLITITDRSVTGLVHRDQLVGPYQIPVADCAVIATVTFIWGKAYGNGRAVSYRADKGPCIWSQDWRGADQSGRRKYWQETLSCRQPDVCLW